jgi:hypothetical protein
VGTDIPDTREAQLQGLTQPRVGFATAVDLGDSTSPYNDIHPRFKQEVPSLYSSRSISSFSLYSPPIFLAPILTISCL